MRFKNRFQRFMNHRAPANGRYKPTCYEHAANCYTHAFLIVPAIVGSALLHRLSDDCWEKITAWIYGMGLCALFIVSTVFHIVSWKKSHLRTVEHCFHMCDRMVIYFFIAASYAPWLNLRELGPLASHMRWFIWLMAAGGTIYVFLYHEKYKVVELFFYLTMGFSPALVVTSMALYQALQDEKKSDTVFWTHILMDSKPRGRGSSCSSPSSITFPSQKVLLMVTKEPPLDHEEDGFLGRRRHQNPLLDFPSSLLVPPDEFCNTLLTTTCKSRPQVSAKLMSVQFTPPSQKRG